MAERFSAPIFGGNYCWTYEEDKLAIKPSTINDTPQEVTDWKIWNEMWSRYYGKKSEKS